MISAGAHNHNIIDASEAAFAIDPPAITMQEIAVGENCSFVELDAAAMELLSAIDVRRMEEIPARLIDDLIRRMSEDVNDGIRRVQNASLRREI